MDFIILVCGVKKCPIPIFIQISALNWLWFCLMQGGPIRKEGLSLCLYEPFTACNFVISMTALRNQISGTYIDPSWRKTMYSRLQTYHNKLKLASHLIYVIHVSLTNVFRSSLNPFQSNIYMERLLQLYSFSLNHIWHSRFSKLKLTYANLASFFRTKQCKWIK